jgi:hypothetical protein
MNAPMAGDSYKPRFPGMLVVAVTAASAHEKPTVLLDELDGFRGNAAEGPGILRGLANFKS